jgi:hypothetical protein
VKAPNIGVIPGHQAWALPNLMPFGLWWHFALLGFFVYAPSCAVGLIGRVNMAVEAGR